MRCQREVIACIFDRAVAQKILKHLGLPVLSIYPADTDLPHVAPNWIDPPNPADTTRP